MFDWVYSISQSNIFCLFWLLTWWKREWDIHGLQFIGEKEEKWVKTKDRHHHHFETEKQREAHHPGKALEKSTTVNGSLLSAFSFAFFYWSCTDHGGFLPFLFSLFASHLLNFPHRFVVLATLPPRINLSLSVSHVPSILRPPPHTHTLLSYS